MSVFTPLELAQKEGDDSLKLFEDEVRALAAESLDITMSYAIRTNYIVPGIDVFAFRDLVEGMSEQLVETGVVVLTASDIDLYLSSVNVMRQALGGQE